MAAVVYDLKLILTQKKWTEESVHNKEWFQLYIRGSEEWRNNEYYSTLYEGYPFKQPCDPPNKDTYWYVNPNGTYGVWVYASAAAPQVISNEFGWSPFVRKSIIPVFESLRIKDRYFRNRLAWIVDEQGYGQYGQINEDGTIWVPDINPTLN